MQIGEIRNGHVVAWATGPPLQSADGANVENAEKGTIGENANVYADIVEDVVGNLIKSYRIGSFILSVCCEE